MRDKEELSAEIGDDGSIHVEKHFVGKLRGFQFTPETHADSVHGKAARHAASQVLSRELGMRARRVAAAKPDAFKLTRSGRILWREDEIARLEPSQDPLKPSVTLLADEHLSAPDKEKVQARLEQWVNEVVAERLKPLAELAKAEDLTGLARGIAFRLKENLGVLKRETVAGEIKSLDQEARAQLRKYGVRFGAFNIFFPLLVKPAPTDLLATLWTLKYAADNGLDREAMPDLPPTRRCLTPSTASPAITHAARARCASTSWSGSRT
jgi:ATP-dependent RNA helicase SUPV3L1/SUV3